MLGVDHVKHLGAQGDCDLLHLLWVLESLSLLRDLHISLGLHLQFLRVNFLVECLGLIDGQSCFILFPDFDFNRVRNTLSFGTTEQILKGIEVFLVCEPEELNGLGSDFLSLCAVLFQRSEDRCHVFLLLLLLHQIDAFLQ